MMEKESGIGGAQLDSMPEEKVKIPRRPKSKQVCSRYMSPVTSSTPRTCDVRRSKITTVRQRPQSARRLIPPSSEGPSYYADQGRPGRTPYPISSHGNIPVQRKCVTKLFKENGEQNFNFQRMVETTHHSRPVNSKIQSKSYSKIDTPILLTSRVSPVHDNSTLNSAITEARPSVDGTKELQEFVTDSQISLECSDAANCIDQSLIDNYNSTDLSESETCSIGSQPPMCNSPPIIHQNGKIRHHQELRTSMPESNLLPTISARLMGEEGNTSSDPCRASASACYHSINSSLSFSRQASSMSKSFHRPTGFPLVQVVSTKMGNAHLPPVYPIHVRAGADLRKVRSIPANVEEIHQLKLLYNRHLQWRFVNAKAEVTSNNQKKTAEKSLAAAAEKLADFRTSVGKKRIELVELKQRLAVISMIKQQLPLMKRWEAMQEGFSSSLVGLVSALNNALVQLPIVGDVQVDVENIGESLLSASNIVDGIWSNLSQFQHMAEEMDTTMSTLAIIANREKIYMQKGGELLSMAHQMQVEECSLRAQLIQLKTNTQDCNFREADR